MANSLTNPNDTTEQEVLGRQYDGSFTSTLRAGSKTVAAAATPETLVATSTKARNVIIRAKSGNTLAVLIGPVGSEYFPLYTKDAVSLDIDDLVKISVKAGADGEGVDYLANAA
jgi:hypothetical protein